MPSRYASQAYIQCIYTAYSKSSRAMARPSPLNRNRLIAEALAMLDEEGLERFSLRRLADRLGVTPMAVYNHVGNKRDLLQAVADAVVSEADYVAARGDWRQVVGTCFRTLRKTCLAHPGAVPLIESSEQLHPSIFRPMEITLAALRGAGLGATDAVRAYFLLTAFTLGQVGYQIKGWGRGVDPRAAIREARISRNTFPAVFDAHVQDQWDFDQAFEFGLSVILAGIAAKVRTR
jgi:TetR/AcrR family transcriptional regulator, tetracycline repressor protein